MKQYRALIISCILLVIVTVFAVAAYSKLSAANELDRQKKGAAAVTESAAQNIDAETMLDYMAIMMDSDQLSDQSSTVNLQLSDDENYLLKIHHGVLLYYPGEQDDKADLTIQTRKLGILAIAARNEDNIGKLVTSVEGDQELYKALCDSMVSLKLYFNIAEP